MSARVIVRPRIARRIAAGLAAVALPAGMASGHAALLDVNVVEAVGIHAFYDTGEPMAEAQVSVFAPDDPTTPWRVGQTDATGRYVFAPDDRAGRWAIQVRQAGHGAIGYVEMTPDTEAAVLVAGAATGGTTPLQRILMVACVLWGSIGTALYFQRSRRAGAS